MRFKPVRASKLPDNPEQKRRVPRVILIGQKLPQKLLGNTNTSPVSRLSGLAGIFRELGMFPRRKSKTPPATTVVSGGLPGLGKR